MSGRLLSIGECMVELAQAGDGLLRKGFAGDTFNTAWYARLCAAPGWQVDYLTALGDDQTSEDMLGFMANAGIGTETIRRLPGRMPGLSSASIRSRLTGPSMLSVGHGAGGHQWRLP